MGDLSLDVERCLRDCACDAEQAQRAACSCVEGRPREAKRVLLGERQRLLDEMHASQRGIDAIDHLLHRVSCECCAHTSQVGAVPGPRAGATVVHARSAHDAAEQDAASASVAPAVGTFVGGAVSSDAAGDVASTSETREVHAHV